MTIEGRFITHKFSTVTGITNTGEIYSAKHARLLRPRYVQHSTNYGETEEQNDRSSSTDVGVRERMMGHLVCLQNSAS
jgi:hypothetical protein